MRRALAPIAAVILAVALAPAARADEAARLYDPAVVAQIDITLSDDARQALLDDPKTYVPATLAVSIGDDSFDPRPAQVKLKGHGAFRPLGKKAAFKLKLAKKDRLLGLKKLTLNNMVQDPSMLHETLGYEVLRAAGVPAPRTGFAYVRVNGVGYGLYLDLETYDDVSLAHLFASTQHLYEANDPGVDVTPGGAGAYEIDEGDEDDRGDLEALVDAANTTGGDWSDGMAASADLDEMTRMWAGEQFIGHWDGYSVRPDELSPNNYYLHSDEDGRFAMLASGLDQTFSAADPFPGAGRGVLITRCLADASCLEAFGSQLGAVAAAADGFGIGVRLDALAATVAPWRDCDDLEQWSDASWQTGVVTMRHFIRDRRIAAAAYLGRPTPTPVPALESTARPALSPTGCPMYPHPPVVKPEPKPTPTPTPTPPAAQPVATPPAVAVLGASAAGPARKLRPRRLTARVRARTHRLRVSGSLLPPAGLERACGGRVEVHVDAGSRMVAMQQLDLRRNCTFRSSVAIGDPGHGRLTVRVRFLGNDRLLPRWAARRTLRI